jgi:transposase InsO family protein
MPQRAFHSTRGWVGLSDNGHVTTDSDDDLGVFLNLSSRMKLTGLNQLWVAGITYIRLQKEFVYLAVVLDSFSRKVVGWSLARTCASRLPITELEQTIVANDRLVLFESFAPLKLFPPQKRLQPDLAEAFRRQ